MHDNFGSINPFIPLGYAPERNAPHPVWALSVYSFIWLLRCPLFGPCLCGQRGHLNNYWALVALVTPLTGTERRLVWHFLFSFYADCVLPCAKVLALIKLTLAFSWPCENRKYLELSLATVTAVWISRA